MKKILCAILSAALVLAIAPAAFANISVTLDGAAIEFDVPPQMVDNRTMVPLRAIFEALGAEIDWIDDEDEIAELIEDLILVNEFFGIPNAEAFDWVPYRPIVVADNGIRGVAFQINSPVILVSYDVDDIDSIQWVKLDVPPLIIDNRTLVPARAIAESFGVNVDWNQAAQTVVLTTGAATYTPAPYVPVATGGLVGEWNWLGLLYYTFNADGSGIMFDTDIWWASRNGVLYICITPDLCGSMNDCFLPMQWYYSISGNQMVLTSRLIDSTTYTYTRR